MIRMLLMALGAYTLYRIYAPLGTDEPQRIADQRRSTGLADGGRRAGGSQS